MHMVKSNQGRAKRNRMDEKKVRYLVLLAILIVVCGLLSAITTTFLSLQTVKNIINQISVQDVWQLPYLRHVFSFIHCNDSFDDWVVCGVEEDAFRDYAAFNR